MDFSVRPAVVKDAYGIARVHVASWRETYRGLVPDKFLDALSEERRFEQWKNSIEDAANVYHRSLVAQVDGRIVGFANYGEEREQDPVYRGELFAIYILKQFQGRGIGRALTRETAIGLLDLGFRSMLVWVLAGNPSREFYEHMGGKYLRENRSQLGAPLCWSGPTDGKN